MSNALEEFDRKFEKADARARETLARAHATLDAMYEAKRNLKLKQRELISMNGLSSAEADKLKHKKEEALAYFKTTTPKKK